MIDNKIKDFLIPILCIIFLLFLLLPINIYKREKHIEKKNIKIGVFLYKADDIFISNLSKEIEKYAKEFEKENKIKINMEVLNASGNQDLQDRQIERFVSLGYDVLCVNPVERTDVSGIIDLCMKKDLPLVFFNRKPVEDDMKRYDKLYYIGTDPKEEAIKQGKMLVDLYKKDKRSLDLNDDGKIDYVLLEGEASHQDSLIRTKWTVKTLQDEAIPINKIAGGVANWDTSQATALMEKWLKEYAGEIELVISNNDSMAMGAIEAIEREKDFRGIKVVGIDGIAEALEQINKKTMYGTVSNEIDNYAKVIIDIAAYRALNRDFPTYIKNGLENDKYFYIEQKAITIDNVGKKY